MEYDIGHANEGRRHLRTALRLCRDSDDDALAAEMLAGMSHQSAFYRSADDAVDLALASRQSAKSCGLPLLVAESAVMEAHGLALQGDKRGCLRALSVAEKSFVTAERFGHDAPAWLGLLRRGIPFRQVRSCISRSRPTKGGRTLRAPIPRHDRRIRQGKAIQHGVARVHTCRPATNRGSLHGRSTGSADD